MRNLLSISLTIFLLNSGFGFSAEGPTNGPSHSRISKPARICIGVLTAFTLLNLGPKFFNQRVAGPQLEAKLYEYRDAFIKGLTNNAPTPQEVVSLNQSRAMDSSTRGTIAYVNGQRFGFFIKGYDDILSGIPVARVKRFSVYRMVNGQPDGAPIFDSQP